MGLDLAEIFMDLEDAFGIHITEQASLDSPLTVGGIIACVRRLLGPADRDSLIERHVFLRLQRAFAALPDGPARLRPSDPVTLSAAGPVTGAELRERWREVELSAGLDLPPLTRRPGWLIAGILTLGGGIALVFVHPLGGLAMLGAGSVMLRIDPARMLRPPAGTMADLTRTVLARNVKRLVRQHGPLPDRLVERMVIDIVAQRLSIDPARIAPGSRLVLDLGAG
jgi:acyl carrier protein